MKKIICIALSLFAFLAFSFPLVSAISTSMNESYDQGETMIIEVQGNILEAITMQEVIFKRGHVSVPFDYGVEKVEDSYFIWAIAPLTEMNYSLLLKNVMTTIGGQIRQIDYIQNFSVTENLTDYSVKPGVIESDRDFEIEIRLNEDINKEIEIDFIEKKNITLKPGENTIKFSISDIYESGIYNLTIGKYFLPAYIRINETRAKPSEIIITNVSNVTNLEELRDISESGGAIDAEREKYHCYEYPGKICRSDEVCSGQTIVSKDGPCCVNGDCGTAEEEEGSLAWIGWLIAALVVIAGIYIWVRYRRIKKETEPVKKKALGLEKKIP